MGLSTFELSSAGKLAHGAVTVGTTAIVFRAADPRRKSLIVQCLGPGDVYPGSATVATTNTIKIASGGTAEIDKCTDTIYMVASQPGTDVRFFEESMLP